MSRSQATRPSVRTKPVSFAHRLGDRVTAAFETVFLLYVCAGAVGLWVLWRTGLESWREYLIALGVPASASLMFLLGCLVAPGLLPRGAARFPHCLTLPFVYGTCLLASEALWTTGPSVLVKTPSVLVVAELWTQPVVMVLVAAVQVSVLALWPRGSRASR